MRPDILDNISPGLGRGWAEPLFGSATNVFVQMLTYAAQWEAAAARWAEDDHTQLQPTEPCWIYPMHILAALMMQSAQAKELELCARASATPLYDTMPPKEFGPGQAQLSERRSNP